jgi:hypothetical protein
MHADMNSIPRNLCLGHQSSSARRRKATEGARSRARCFSLLCEERSALLEAGQRLERWSTPSPSYEHSSSSNQLALALAQGCYDPVVDMRTLVAQIDEEIARLEQARSLLAGTAGQPHRGRPPGRSTKKTAGRPPLSPEARAKIAAAQKRRWAKAKKEASA